MSNGIPLAAGETGTAEVTLRPAERSPSVVRGLGSWDTTLLTVGSVVGTGIFLTTSDMAKVLPHTGLILGVWAVCGLLTLAGALTYAELGAMFPRTGGLYHFLREAYGPLWGFLYGWAAFLVIMSGGIAALGVAFGEYFGSFFPFFATQHRLFAVTLGHFTWAVNGGQLAAALAILVLTVVNHLGLKEGAGVQNALTVLKIGSIVAFVLVGLFTPAATPMGLAAPFAMPLRALTTAFGVALIAALWTYDGWYGATCSAGEMRDPGRNLPRGIIWGTVIVTVLYVLLNLVYARAIPVGAMATTPRIGEAAAVVLWGNTAGRLVSIAVLISTFGCISSTILYSSRIYVPMAEDGLFFRSLAVIDPRFRVPVRSLWAQTGWALLLTFSGTYDQLYTYVVFAGILFHAGIGASIFVLRRRRPEALRPYRAWGYPVVPAVFLLSCLLLVGNTLIEKPVESLLGLGLVAVGLPAYFWMRVRQRRATAAARS